MTGRAVLIRGNALALPLADATVDLIVTSPPYFALRSYQDGGEHYDGQIGAEATPGEFVDALIEATREMIRVLKPSGSIFVNLGDKYAGSNGQSGGPSQLSGATYSPDGTRTKAAKRGGFVPLTTVRPKSLIGIPWRYAIRCVDELDLILRAEIIWAKPNGLPESVTDRVSRKHEQWFHFTKEPRYYANIDLIREEHKASSLARAMPHRADVKAHEDRRTIDMKKACHPLGKAPGSWWSIPTEPLRVDPALGVDHFAAFPTEWPRRLILGWSPEHICTACGEGRRPNAGRNCPECDAFIPNQGKECSACGFRNTEWKSQRVANPATRAGEADMGPLVARRSDIASRRIIEGTTCACDTPTALTRPAIVLDPFGGTGTTAAVAKALGRTGISVDLSADYLRLADWRTNGPGYDKVLRKVTRSTSQPAKESIGQLNMMIDLEQTP